ncbi:MAG: helix-turn-helix domain-containing protein [Kiritimatiellae bacterium]|nr:helix-turn-helix domain-containing protein [Kiritimatiellia bacterium]
MKGKSCILYLDTIPGDRIQAVKFAGVQRYAAARGWEAVSVCREDSQSDALSALLALRRPRGCVVQCHLGASPIPPSCFGKIPAAYLDAGPDFKASRVARVVADDRAVARLAMQELASMRPAALAFVGWRNQQPWCDIREEVFREEAERAELAPIVFERDPVGGCATISRDMRLAAWIAELPRHTAVFAANDVVAHEVLVAARAAHLSIPYDIAVIGADGSPDSSEAGGAPLSTVRIDHERSGWRAARAAAEGACGVIPYGPLMISRRKSTGGFGRRVPFVHQALETIRRDASEGLTPEALIAQFPCSRRLFELRFREATGHSVLDEIRHVRLERACAMLSGGDAPVATVADMCGFGSYDSFHDLFRRQFGMAPSAYRALHRG